MHCPVKMDFFCVLFHCALVSTLCHCTFFSIFSPLCISVFLDQSIFFVRLTFFWNGTLDLYKKIHLVVLKQTKKIFLKENNNITLFPTFLVRFVIIRDKLGFFEMEFFFPWEREKQNAQKVQQHLLRKVFKLLMHCEQNRFHRTQAGNFRVCIKIKITWFFLDFYTFKKVTIISSN